jgi:hypothetical protein
MSKVVDIKTRLDAIDRVVEKTPPSGPIDPPGSGGNNGGMEHRVTALETRLDTVLPTLASKADIADVRADIQRGTSETHKWMIATVIGLFLGFGGLFLAMSNALKPAAPHPTPQQPVIINVPAPAAPQQAPAPAPKK